MLPHDNWPQRVAELTTGGISEETVAEWLHEARDLFRARDGSLVDHPAQSTAIVLQGFAAWAARRPSQPLLSGTRDAAIQLYRDLGPQSHERYLVLYLFSYPAGREELSVLADCMIHDPPQANLMAVAPLAALWNRKPASPEALYPRLLDAMQHPQLASGILDLANHWTRTAVLPSHPGSGRGHELIGLLEGLLAQLESIDRPPEQEGMSVASRLEHAIALAISLCDAVALIGDDRARSVLDRLATVPHRRLRVEAEAALVRLGDPGATDRLLAMAAEPVVRLYVLAYARELGCEDKLPESFVGPEAIAEAELAMWLAQPDQFGMAPRSLELVCHATLSWPGYEEPRICYLYRYTYGLPDEEGRPLGRIISNLGIAGPVTSAVVADLANLSPQDAFAIFAGQDVDHAEISEEFCDNSSAPRPDVARLVRILVARGFDDIQPRIFCDFFGTAVLTAHAVRGGVAGWVVADGEHVQWTSIQGIARPLDAELALCLYKGRRLLRSFNGDPEVWDLTSTSCDENGPS